MPERKSAAPNIMPLGHSSRAPRAITIPQPDPQSRQEVAEPVTAAAVAAPASTPAPKAAAEDENAEEKSKS